MTDRLIDSQPLCLLRREATVIRGAELAGELPRGPGGVRLGGVVLVEDATDILRDLPVDHLLNQLAAVGPFQNPLAESIHPLALLIHHLVVFEEILADVEVAFFDLLLRRLDPPRDHPALDRFAFLHAQTSKDVFHPFAGENAHQIVFEREEEPAGTGISLAAAAAAQLQIDAAGLMPLRADDVEAAHAADEIPFRLHVFLRGDLRHKVFPLLLRHIQPRGIGVLQAGPGHGVGIAAENDVGAAARHVRGDGDGIEPTRLSDDLSLAFVMLGVEDLMIDAALLQQCREQFALFDRHCAHEHRAAPTLDVANGFVWDRVDGAGIPLLKLHPRSPLRDDPPDAERSVGKRQGIPAVEPLHLVGDGQPLLPLRSVDHVGVVDPLHPAIGRNRDDIQMVDLPKLARLGHGGAGHAANFAVELEEILQGDGGERLRLFLDPHSLLRLHRLVESVRPLAAGHEPTGELVDDHHLVPLHDIIHITLVEMAGLEGIVDEMRPFHIAGGVEALHAGKLLGQPNSIFGQRDRVFFFLHLEMLVGLELAGDLVGLGVFGDVVMGRPGDDQRRAGLIDQDVVNFVDNGEVEETLALLHFFRKPFVAPGGHAHVVAQVVEAEFVVGAVGDVGGIGFLAFGGIHLRLDRPHRQAQADVERPHPFHVAAGEVIVDCDDMHPFALEGIEIGRQRGDECFALAGNHFSDGSRMEHHPADQLHVIVPHPEIALSRLAADGEGLDQQVIERLSGSEPAPEFGRLAAQLSIGHRLVSRFERIDRFDLRFQPPDIAGVG